MFFTVVSKRTKGNSDIYVLERVYGSMTMILQTPHGQKNWVEGQVVNVMPEDLLSDKVTLLE